MEPFLVSIVEAGRMLGLGRTKIYDLVKQGELEVVSIGRRRLVSVASVKAFVARLNDSD